MQQGEFTFDVLVHGRSIREYPHQGRTYVEGRKGSEYILRVHNQSSGRVLAVVTVDGLSVMDGSDGGFDGRGYVVAAFSYVRIPGWRLDNDEVAKFVFGSKPASYAAQTGRPQNVGVIGCAVFREVKPPEPTVIYRDRYVYPWCPPWPIEPKHPWRPWRPYEPFWHGGGTVTCSMDRGSSTGSFTAYTSSDGPDHTQASLHANSLDDVPQNLGTEFGQAQSHHVYEVGFNREASPATVFEVWYDDRAGLQRRGIDLRGGLTVGRPTAFPRQGCQPPRGWKG